MIDAHVHFWEYNKLKDAWITDEMKVLQSDFLPRNLQPILEENKINGIIAVQADQSENETRFLLELANENPMIKGIVGWVDLQNENLENKLLYYSKHSIIKGFRHIVQSEPDGFLQNKRFRNGIKILRDFGFTYDILIYESQLKETIGFVNKFPDQKFIIDHCGKPSIKNNQIKEWENLINELAGNKNIYCKLSVLIT
jgi:L-fuconolactonase